MNHIQKASRIVVTGGAGFIGSALVRALLARGHKVVCADNLSTGKRSNVADLEGRADFTFCEGDLANPDFASRVCENADYVLHEAALGSAPRSVLHPEETFRANVDAFCSIFNAAAKAGVKRFVFASSSSIYGDHPALPKKEDAIGNPLSPYALTKFICERTAALFGKIYHLDYIALRYFNVYGPGQDPVSPYAAVIPRFALALLRHETPEIFGSGRISRDFTFIGDVVRANLLALEAPADACGQAYNIAGGRAVTLDELFAALKRNLAAFDPEIGQAYCRYAPERPGDIPHSLADISRACAGLGYQPETDLESGLGRTAEYYWKTYRTERTGEEKK